MHYYQHHIGDYRKDTTHLSFLEHGIYRHLLDSYYLNEIPLIADLDKLMRSHSIRNADEKQALCNVLADFFLLTEKGYIHARCDAEIDAFHAKSDQAKKAAMARWANRNKDSNADALQPHSDRNADGMPTNNHKPITIIGAIAPKTPKGKRFDLEKIPTDWIEFCRAERKDLIPEKVFEGFRDYWISTPGQKGVKADWLATWRNWVRNQKQGTMKVQPELPTYRKTETGFEKYQPTLGRYASIQFDMIPENERGSL